jgi:hypothetical protein
VGWDAWRLLGGPRFGGLRDPDAPRCRLRQLSRGIAPGWRVNWHGCLSEFLHLLGVERSHKEAGPSLAGFTILLVHVLLVLDRSALQLAVGKDVMTALDLLAEPLARDPVQLHEVGPVLLGECGLAGQILDIVTHLIPSFLVLLAQIHII